MALCLDSFTILSHFPPYCNLAPPALIESGNENPDKIFKNLKMHNEVKIAIPIFKSKCKEGLHVHQQTKFMVIKKGRESIYSLSSKL